MTQTTPDSDRAQRAMSANAARVIETTRRAWLAAAAQPASAANERRTANVAAGFIDFFSG